MIVLKFQTLELLPALWPGKASFALDLECMYLIDKYYLIPSLLIFSSVSGVIKHNLLDLKWAAPLSCHWPMQQCLLRGYKETGPKVMLMKSTKIQVTIDWLLWAIYRFGDLQSKGKFRAWHLKFEFQSPFASPV